MHTINFTNGFNGEYLVGNQKLIINRDGGLQPYDMTFGAIASCFYATYLRVLEDRGLTIKRATINIDGVKRKMTPTTLEHIDLEVLVTSDESEEDLRHCFEVAFRQCSMLQTFVKVAEINKVFKKLD